VARLMAPALSAKLGQTVVIENRPGAAGNIAAQAVRRDKRDGYTVLLGTDSIFTMNPFLFKNLGFDPLTDFTLVEPLADSALFIVASPSTHVKTLEQLVALVRANPGKFNYSAPTGTPHHLAGERLSQAAGLDWVRVSYSDGQQAVNDIVSGQLQFGISVWPSIQQFVNTGRLNVIAVTTAQRLQAMPDVPTVSETYPGMVDAGWFGLFVGSGTPPQVIEKLAAAADYARRDPELAPRLQAQGMQVSEASNADFIKAMHATAKQRGELIQSRGISLN